MDIPIDSILCGDCLEIMAEIPENSFDSIITDPPYGLKFMGKAWDHGIPNTPFWEEALRVAKPGAHLLAFGGTRTHHRLMVAIEDAGWEIRDCLMWLYGSGFPKGQDIGKMIDKAAGVMRNSEYASGKVTNVFGNGKVKAAGVDRRPGAKLSGDPISQNAIRWDGWNTTLKPAWEPIIMARKPIDGSVVQNVLKWQTGGINIDECRIEGTDTTTRHNSSSSSYMTGKIGEVQPIQEAYITGSNKGRYPANLILDDEAGALLDHQSGKISKGHFPSKGASWGSHGIYGRGKERNCEERFLTDTGGASRFFYCAKASPSERGEGNKHPTVKPLKLMRYLCRMITPSNGVILDQFCGSGSTLIAAWEEGFHYVGIEKDPDNYGYLMDRLSSRRIIPN